MNSNFDPQKFKVFKYKLPEGSVKEYSERAISVLKKIQKLNPEYLKYFLASNSVLTLSGVRAMDTYLGLEGLTSDQIKEVTQILSENGLILMAHDSEYDSSGKDIYSIFNLKALKLIPKQYGLKAWIEPSPPYTFDRFLSWSYVVEHRIANAIAEGSLPIEWDNDHWVVHNIRFGILLGYPGEAIAGLCWADYYHKTTNEEVELDNAKFAYEKAHNAVSPSYSYLRQQAEDQNIINHQKLWGDILTAVYESEWVSKNQS